MTKSATISPPSHPQSSFYRTPLQLSFALS